MTIPQTNKMPPVESESTPLEARDAQGGEMNVPNGDNGESHDLKGALKTETQGLKESVSTEASSMLSSAKEEAHGLGDQAKEQGAAMLNETKEQLKSRSQEQQNRLGDTLDTFASDLREMSKDQDSLAANLASGIGIKAESLANMSREADLGSIANSIKGFAKNHPGTFLLGAGVLGFALARVVKASRDEGESSEDMIVGEAVFAVEPADFKEGETIPRPLEDSPPVGYWNAEGEMTGPRDGDYAGGGPVVGYVQEGFIAGDDPTDEESTIYPVEGRARNV